VTSLDRRAKLVESNLDLVREIAGSVRRRVGVRAEFDDLVGDGNVGLIRAAASWDSTVCPFRPWAATFVRRAMIDGLRATHGRKFRETACSLDAAVGDSENDDSFADRLVDPRADVVSIVEARETLVERALAAPLTDAERDAGRPLAEGEIDVLAGAALGETSKVTAARRCVSVETVKAQRKKVIAKLGATEITNAVFMATRSGLLDHVPHRVAA